MNLKEKLHQAKIKNQEKEIKKLQTKLSQAKQELDQSLNKKENELKVMIHKGNKKLID